MCPLRYYPMLRHSKDPTYLRFEMVRYARANGIKACARQFSTTVKTVRKWLRRWQPGSLRGLTDRSRAPHHPRHQYTAREVVSGWQYPAYAQERTLAYSKLFAQIILIHLENCGVKFKGARFQTDNGCEFVGNWQAKHDSAFTETVEGVKGLRHTTIPPRAHTWQSDVETVHRLIEDEFYEVEQFSSRADFLATACADNLWFNVGRGNSGKEGKTPWEIIHEREPKLSPAICALPPVFPDELFMKKLDSRLLRGYDLIPHPYR